MQAVVDDADWNLKAVTDGRIAQDRAGPRPDAPDLARPRGSAPTPACSSTPRSTAGTPRPTPAASTARTRARSTCTSTTRRATSPASTCCKFLRRATATLRRRRRSSTPSRSCSPPRRSWSATADYPTEPIGETTRQFRQLGLGYANLGALLMALGLPYDSDEGRAWAAAITALMTGHAYATSARTAARMGPFAGFAGEPRAHAPRAAPAPRRQLPTSTRSSCPPSCWPPRRRCWDEAVRAGRRGTACATRRPPCWPPPAPSA